MEDGNKGGGGDVGDKVKELMARRERAQADLKDLESGDKGQVSTTDSDARLLSKGDQTIAGYNVQSVVDDKHKLIVASEVVNRSDAGHLHEMAKAAKEILEAETLQILADTAYYSSADIKACEDDGIKAYVPPHEGNGKLKKQGRFVREDFSYDAATNTYRCPAGQLLHPTKTPWTNTSGRIEIRYLGSKASCGGCPLRASCLSPGAKYRSISRWEHEDVLDRHRQRMASEGAGELMRRRSAIVEHPFGTLKCRAGYQHFLVRGFDKVRGEWSLMALCYNFTRALNILGFDRFVAYMAEKARVLAKAALLPFCIRSACFEGILGNIGLWFAVVTLRPTPAHNHNSCPASSGKSALQARPSHPKRGGSRSSRTCGGMRWTRQRRACNRDRRAARGSVSEQRRAGRTMLMRTAKSCGPGTRCWRQAGGGDAIQPGRIKPSFRR